MEYLSSSRDETIAIGVQIGRGLKPGSIICLHGDLAAGKTTLVKGLAKGFGDYKEEEINSPTFVYLNVYEGKKTVYHFDFYRLTNPDEFIHMGFDEYLFSDGICCIEWPGRVGKYLPDACVNIELTSPSVCARKIRVYETKKC